MVGVLAWAVVGLLGGLFAVLARVLGALSLVALTVGLLWLWPVASASSAALPGCSQSGSAVACVYTAAGTYTFTVPAGVTSLDVTAVGASGGRGGAGLGAGGAGASVEATKVLVGGGQALTVVVGGVGAPGTLISGGAGGAPGGGAGGDYPGVNRLASGDGGGGGGLSGLVGTSDRPLVIAAGGGGGGGGNGGAGGPGGTPDGNNGGPSADGSLGGGTGGTTTGPGAGGSGAGGGGAGGDGTSLAGGQGGASSRGSNSNGGDNSSGGGGGGGYFGGGGGGGGDPSDGVAAGGVGSAGGGGGGSSFGPAGSVFSTPYTDASVTISYMLAATSTSVSSPANGTAGAAIAVGSIGATLSGATADATGTISFTVFGPRSAAPSDCATGGTPVGDPVTVSGDGSYHPSAVFTPGHAGRYWWYASYGGDEGNQPSNTGCGAGMKSTVVSAPTLSALAVSPRTFALIGRRVGRQCLVVTRANHHHHSCTRPLRLRVSYTIDAPATVTITIQEVLRGRLVNGRCRAPGRRNRHHRACTRLLRLRGTLVSTGVSGPNSFAFTGKISGRTLGPSTYRLTATTIAAGLTGVRQSATFRVVR